MNDTVVFSSPFTGEAGRGMGFDDVVCCPSPCLLFPIPTPTPQSQTSYATFPLTPGNHYLLMAG